MTKTTSYLSTILTLLMLLLVGMAAFVFLFQGRQVLQTRNEELAAELEKTAADALLLEGQLVESQQELDELERQLGLTSSAVVSLEQERTAILAQPPLVQITSPTPEMELLVDEPIAVDVTATDVMGITAVSLSVGEQLLSRQTFEDSRLVRVTSEWTPPEPGEYLLNITVETGRQATLITNTLQVMTESGFSQTTIDAPTGEPARLANILAEVWGWDAESVAVVTGVPPVRTAPPIVSPTAVSTVLLDYLDIPRGGTPAASPSASYDAGTQQVVVSDMADFSQADVQLAYIAALHEAGVDQQFGLPNSQQVNHDTWLAQQMVLLGESAWLQNQVIQGGYLNSDQAESLNQTAVANGWLALLSEQGQSFVETLFFQGGLPILNAVWRSRPQSTEQVLHPEKYFNAEAPQPVEIADLQPLLGSDWTIVAQGTLGEAAALLMLSRYLPAETAATAVSGWGGDRFVLYQTATGETVFVLVHTWDAVDEATQFASQYSEYATLRLAGASFEDERGGVCWQGDEQTICLSQQGDRTTIVQAIDSETAVAVSGFLATP